jgi:chromosome segregation ATPase
MLNVLEADTKDFQKVVNNILIEVKPMRLRGKISDDFLGYVNELRQRITDLEAKLAESEKKIKRARETRQISDEFRIKAQKNQLKEKEKAIVKLKQQLAESNELRIATKWKVDDLEKQLSDKEKEIEDAKDISRRLIRTCGKANCYGKNQTAIAELEKVKEWANNMYDGWKSNDGVNLDAKTGICNTLQAVCGMVNQQIKSLKGDFESEKK